MQFEASRLEGLEHRTDAQSAPEVFFTPIITPESLVAAYHALGRKPEGKTAIKVHSGESEKSNNLNPSLVKDLVQEIGGTLVECATAYDGNRETPEKSLATFKKHGYADLAPIQIMDMGGEIEIPVAKHRHIAYDIVGKHIDDYDSIFVLSHFKGHRAQERVHRHSLVERQTLDPFRRRHQGQVGGNSSGCIPRIDGRSR